MRVWLEEKWIMLGTVGIGLLAVGFSLLPVWI